MSTLATFVTCYLACLAATASLKAIELWFEKRRVTAAEQFASALGLGGTGEARAVPFGICSRAESSVSARNS